MLGMFHADISRTQPPESCAHLVPAHATRPRQRNRPRTDSPKPASESHIDAQPASSSGARLGALPLRPSPPLVPMTALALVCATLADGATTSSPPRSSSTPLVDHATRVASTAAASKATGPPNGSIGSLRRKKRGRAQRLARCGLTGGSLRRKAVGSTRLGGSLRRTNPGSTRLWAHSRAAACGARLRESIRCGSRGRAAAPRNRGEASGGWGGQAPPDPPAPR